MLRTQIFEVDPKPNRTFSNFNEPEPNRTIQFKYRTRTELHKKFKIFKTIKYLIDLKGCYSRASFFLNKIIAKILNSEYQ